MRVIHSEGDAASMPDTVPVAIPFPAYLIFRSTLKAIAVLILEIRKLRIREARQLAQSHTAEKQKNLNSKQNAFTLRLASFYLYNRSPKRMIHYPI